MIYIILWNWVSERLRREQTDWWIVPIILYRRSTIGIFGQFLTRWPWTLTRSCNFRYFLQPQLIVMHLKLSWKIIVGMRLEQFYSGWHYSQYRIWTLYIFGLILTRRPCILMRLFDSRYILQPLLIVIQLLVRVKNKGSMRFFSYYFIKFSFPEEVKKTNKQKGEIYPSWHFWNES